MKKAFISLFLLALPLYIYAQASGEQIRRKPTTARNSQNKTSGDANLYTKTGSQNGHGYVDLGVSVKWATCNIGASLPEESGNYYAWGEIESKIYYGKDNYNGANKQSFDNISDVANIVWGGKWRMPTYDEFKELSNKCRWKWTSLKGKAGFCVIGKNGNSIFLPAAGFHAEESIYKNGRGYYWTSTLDENVQNPQPYCLQMFDAVHEIYNYMWEWMGLSVRAVYQ